MNQFASNVTVLRRCEPTIIWSWKFDAGPGMRPFAAMAMAEGFLQSRGFSVAPMQGDEPRGVMFGKYIIAKWRDLSPSHILQLHGILSGIMRHGPVTLDVYKTAPPPARSAIARPPYTAPRMGGL